MTAKWSIRTVLALFTAILLTLFISSVQTQAANRLQEVVFIDSTVEDAQTIISLLPPGVTAVRLDSFQDGIAQISEYLKDKHGLNGIHLITHGAPGRLAVGNGLLSTGTLESYQAELADIGDSLRAGGDFLIYGCNAAQGEIGNQFMNQLAEAVNADVAGSEDITSGNPMLGNASLEVQVGHIEAEPLSLQGWNGVLPSVTRNVPIDQDYSLSASDLGYQDYPYIYFESVPSGAQLGLGSASNLIQAGFSYSKSTVDGGDIKFRANQAGTYSFQVRWEASQGLQGDLRSPHTSIFTITINVTNPAPSDITLDNSTVPAGFKGAKVGTLRATDNSLDSVALSILNDPSQMFEISAIDASQKKGLLKVRDGKSLAVGETATVTIRAIDSVNNILDKTFTVMSESPIELQVNASEQVNIIITEYITYENYQPPEAGKGRLIFDDVNNEFGGGQLEIDDIMAVGGLIPGDSLIYTAPTANGTDSFLLGGKYYIVQIGTPNAAPIFTETTTTLTVAQDAAPTEIRSLLKVSDSDSGQTLTWTQSTPPSHGTLTITNSTAASGGSNLMPGGISYKPAAGYHGTDSFVIKVSDGVAEITRTIQVVVQTTLAKPGNVQLSAAGIATWTNVTDAASYELQLYKNNSLLGAPVSLSASTISHNVLSTMRTSGAGTYTVRVKAIGNGTVYLDGSQSDPSNGQAVIQLGTVTSGLTWNGNAALWSPVANAVSYDVQLYKNGTPAGTAVQVLAADAAEGADFTSAISAAGGGTFSFKVTAKGNALFILDGAPSAFSAELIKPILLTVNGIQAASKAYDGSIQATLNVTGASISGVEPGHNVALVTSGAAGTFSDRAAGQSKTVTVSGLQLTGADAGKYLLRAYTTTANITPLAITAGGITSENKVYDGATTAELNTDSASLNGVLDEDNVTISTASASGVYSQKNAGSSIPVTVSGLTLSGLDAGNYTLNPLVISASIHAKTIEAAGISAQNKIYDGSAAAVLDWNQAQLNGIVPSDQAELDLHGAAGAFSVKHVGTGLTVSVSGLGLTGTDAANYTLTPYTTTASITAKRLTLSGITAGDKEYDGTEAASLAGTATLNGVITGDDVSLSGTMAGLFETKNAGGGLTVTVSGLSLDGTDAGNYMLDAYTVEADITQLAITAEGITANPKTYDGAVGAELNLEAAGLVGVLSGDAVTLETGNAEGVFGQKNIGDSIAVTVNGLVLSGVDKDNYILTEYVTTSAITAKTLTLSGLSASDKVYDGTAAAELEGAAVLNGVVNGDNVVLNGMAEGDFVSKNAGTGLTVTVSGLILAGTDAGNYELSGYTTTADITPLAINAEGITAENKVYDGAATAELNTESASLNGVLEADNVTINTASANGVFSQKNAGSNISVTVSGLTLSGSDAGNYTLNPLVISASIYAKTIEASGIAAQDKIYDGSATAVLDWSQAQLNGVVPSDQVELDLHGAEGTFSVKHVGTGLTVSVSGLGLTGTDAANYTLAPYTTTASITAKRLTISGITAADKVYDGTVEATLAGAAILNGAITGDDVAAAGTVAGQFETKNAGSGLTVTVSGLSLGGTDSGNYTLDAYTVEADITPLAITAAGITAYPKTYDGAVAAELNLEAARLDGEISGDAVTLETGNAEGVFGQRNVGDSIVVTVNGLTLSGEEKDNYILMEYGTTSAITAKTLTLSGLSASDKVYDGKTTAVLGGTAILNGVLDGDHVALNGTAEGVYVSKNAGTAVVVQINGLAITGADAGNYALLPYSLSADISAKEIEVTGISAVSRMYDGSIRVELNADAAQLIGLLDGDQAELDASEASGVLENAQPGVDKLVTAAGLKLSGADAANYTLSPYTTKVTITAVPSQPPTTVVEVIVNGKAENAGVATRTQVNNQTVITIAVDEAKLQEKLEAEGTNAIVTIPVNIASDIVVGELNGRMVKAMEQKAAVVVIQTGNASYTLPAEQINIAAISSEIGKEVSLQDIKVKIEIAAPTTEDVKFVEHSASFKGIALVVPPVHFSVTGSYGDTVVEISRFNAYIERTIAIPDGMDPNRITTGVVIEPDGAIRHVPTRVVKIDGRYYAQVNSLTNSIYSVVWHPIEFKDVIHHWAKAEVNDMGSRMVIEGDGSGNFNPNRDITRAEFAAILVRGLGLGKEESFANFYDVETTEWYAGAINTAFAYGLVDGFADGTFRPMDRITREQAMVMIARAMKLTALDSKDFKPSEEMLLQSFHDGDQAAAWAQLAITDSLNAGLVSGRNGDILAPKAFITRAEVAVLISRLLEKSELI